MCGIAGYISQTNKQTQLSNALQLMHYRGPDNKETSIEKLNTWQVGLGHARLSIIDLTSSANQPFYDVAGNYAIVFNGEIYNFKKLKAAHPSINFGTNSDTEVILELYKLYGHNVLNMLRGMFAFIIFDKVNNCVFVARDHLGIKPLYYFADKHNFIFASELKGITAFGIEKIFDKRCVAEFFYNGFLYEPDTGFVNIKKIKPGHFAIIQLANDALEIKEESYWNPFVPTPDISKIELNDLIDEEIDLHQISDAPLGLFFSGGVDSSVILLQVHKQVKATIVKAAQDSVKLSGSSSDYDYAQKIAKILQVKLTEIQLPENTNANIFSVIDLLVKEVEEPIADYTFIASKLISKVSRENGYKVMLSGMGADELFAGYDRHFLVYRERLFNFLKPFILFFGKHSKSFSKKVERFKSYFIEKDFIYKYTSLVGIFSKAEVDSLIIDKSNDHFHSKASLILKNAQTVSKLKQAMYMDIYGFLSHNFLVADKSSMLASIELRVPLATKMLAEKTFSMPDKELIKGFKSKFTLKKYLLRFLPPKIVNRRKAGFNPPLDAIINSLSKDEILNYLHKNNIFNVVNLNFVQNLVDNHFSRKQNNTYKIYHLLFFSAWYNDNCKQKE